MSKPAAPRSRGIGIIFKKLALGFSLIALTAAILLFSDLGSRREIGAKPQRATTQIQVAILQNVSQTVLDDGVAGMIAGLRESGFVDGKNMNIRRYNSEGDMSTLHSIAREITDGKFDLVLTASTPVLQAVANANRDGKVRHVFALVTDPAAAGVGISAEDPLDHPAWLAGYGTMQPVEAAFQLAQEMNPDLRNVGVVWNSAEVNSLAQIELARKLCADNGITLMEAGVENSSGVAEATGALIGRGVDAIWVPGDSTVLVATANLCEVAKRGGVPVFSVIPPTVDHGALFDIGANYFEVGRQTGLLAGEILNGKNPADVEIVNLVPETLALNTTALEGIEGWQIPEGLADRADILITAEGRVDRQEKAPADTEPVVLSTVGTTAARSTPWKIHMIQYTRVLDVEEAEHGVLDGMKKAGLVEGRDYTMKITNAHGDMATVTGLVDAAVTDRADLIITLSTPTLQAAIRRGGDTPIIFTYCADGVVAGAGKSATDHLPNVTGVQTQGAYHEIIDTVLEVMPNVKRLGTLFVPSEVNTVFHRDRVAEAAKAKGIELISLPVESSAEMGDATTALCQRGIDAIAQIPGNLTASAFPALSRAALQNRMPLFATQGSQAVAGAPVVISRDYYDAGVDTAALVARIMRGESPADIPFITFLDTSIILNETAIRNFEMDVPESMRKRAGKILP